MSPSHVERGFTRSGERLPCPPPGGLTDSLGQFFTERMVTVPAVQAPGNPPLPMPEDARGRMLPGDVLLSFIADTLGRAEPGTVVVLASTSKIHTEVVLAALPRLRFLPGEQPAGCKVRQQMDQRFTFRIRR